MLETPLLCRSDTGHTDHAAAAEDLSTSSFLQLAASSSCVVRSCQQASLFSEDGFTKAVEGRVRTLNYSESSESVGLILW